MKLNQLHKNAFACLRQSRDAADRGDWKMAEDLHALGKALLLAWHKGYYA